MVLTVVTGNYEASYALYEAIYRYCGLAALFFLVAALVLFAVLKIPRVLGELSGRTARKAIQEMTGAKEKKTGRGENVRMTGKRQRSGRPLYPAQNTAGTEETTALQPDLQETTMLQDEEETTALRPDLQETTMLQDEEETTALQKDMQETTLQNKEETTILQTALQETTMLQQEEEIMARLQKTQTRQPEFHIVRSIVELHTDETI